MSTGQNLAWRWSRLRAMAPSEVAWRVRDRLRSSWESRRAGRDRFRPLDLPGGELRGAFAESSRALVPHPEWRDTLSQEFPDARARLERAARSALAGRVTLFAREHPVGTRVDWHADPASGVVAPARPFTAIDYRDRATVGSARRIWELNRHHHLAETALWSWAAEDRAAGRFVVEQLLDWCDKNPPCWGINWTSSLELSIRTLAWAEILALLVDAREPALDDRALALLLGAWARQAEHVRTHDSRYSSANNHRIGEAAAVAVAGLVLRFHDRAEEWRQWGWSALESELERQIAPDGVGREQAFAYQRFVLDFAIVALVVGRTHGLEPSPSTRARLVAACDFLDGVMRPDGTLFAVGDDDEGRAFALGEAFEERTSATLECAGWLLGEPKWRRSAHARAGWLKLAGVAAGFVTAREAPGACPRDSSCQRVSVFAEGGYAIASGSACGTPVRVLFDAGPLGLEPLAAHGHADALSLCLWMGGDLLLDPGTGSYHGDPEWRERLRGTSAHNTCAVDDGDQAERRGLFLWARHARMRMIAAGGEAPYFVLAGAHDGYARLGVRELRRFVIGWMGSEGVALLVVDEGLGRDAHALSTPWNLGPGEPELVEPGASPLWRARFASGARLAARAHLLAAPGEGLRSETHRGGDPARGAWYAPRFEEREPQGRIEARAPRASLPASLVWLLHAGVPEVAEPSLVPCPGGLSCRLDLGGGRALRALVTHPSSEASGGDDARLEGRAAAWIEGGAGDGTALAAAVGVVALSAGPLDWRATGTPVTGVLTAAGAAGNGSPLHARKERS